MPIQILTLSPLGGWVVIAVTRQMPGLAGSTAADSMIVFGRATIARLSQERTGFALAMAGFGVAPKGGSPGGCALPVQTGIKVTTSHIRFMVTHYNAYRGLTSNTRVHYVVNTAWTPS
jgi:hypothetical protein